MTFVPEICLSSTCTSDRQCLMRTHLTATPQGPANSCLKNQISESKSEVNALHHLLSVFIMGGNLLIWKRDTSTIIITHKQKNHPAGQ